MVAVTANTSGFSFISKYLNILCGGLTACTSLILVWVDYKSLQSAVPWITLYFF